MALQTLRLGTRSSNLAMTQTRWVAQSLRAIDPSLNVEIVTVTTSGDRISAAHPHASSIADLHDAGVGVFVKELESALFAGEIDAAVHSLKDLPSRLPDGLTLGAIPQREDPRDAIILPASSDDDRPTDWESILASFPEQARVGSGSLRRQAQLLLHRSSLRAVAVRGNIDTRIRRLDEGVCDVLLLAAAGLKRLGLSERISGLLPVEVMIPAPGQGALAVECRTDDTATRSLLERMDQPNVGVAVVAERAFMEATEAGCRLPVGAVALPSSDANTALTHLLYGFFAEPAKEGGWECAVGVAPVSAVGQNQASAKQIYADAGKRLAESLSHQLSRGHGRRVEILD